MIAAPFKDALLKAVAASAVVLNYDDKDDFARLWASAKNGAPEILSNAQGKIAIIIVWEGRARTQIGSAEKLLEPHLTPLDWALAFSNVIVQKGADIAGFQIHIVDLTGRRFQGAWAIRMRHQLLAEMPWVSLHAPLIPAGEVPSYREGYRPILEGMGLLNQNAGIWELVQQGRSLSVSVSQGRGTGLEDLAKQWVASVAQSNDHHDINNVIGPDILAKPERRRDGFLEPFLQSWNGTVAISKPLQPGKNGLPIRASNKTCSIEVSVPTQLTTSFITAGRVSCAGCSIGKHLMKPRWTSLTGRPSQS